RCPRVQARIEVAATRQEQPVEIEHHGPERVEHCPEGVGIGKDLKRIQAANDWDARYAEGEAPGLKDGIGDGLIEPVHLPGPVSQDPTMGEEANARSAAACSR